MEFDLFTTLAAFVVIVGVGVGGLAGSGVMELRTVFTMVAPSMALFGLICLTIGIKHGEYRSGTEH